MATYRTEGIILKRTDYGEADRILTIFTQKKGKLRVLARGVRKMESRKGGNVELLNWATLFLAEGRNMDVLTEVEVKDAFGSIKESLVKAGYAYHILELLDRLLPEREPHLDLFNLTTETLTLMDKEPRQVIIRAFEVKLIRALGFWSLSEVTSEDKNLLQVLEVLAQGSWEEIISLSIDEGKANELEQQINAYLERVLEGKLKSRNFLKRIKDSAH